MTCTTRPPIYEARYNENNNGVYAYIVRIDRDGFGQVIRGFKPRHFVSRKNAERAIEKHFVRFLNIT